MRKKLGVIIIASATYGFSIGSVHSATYAVRDLFKFPLLIFATYAICALAYFVAGQFVSRQLRFAEIQSLALQIFHDISLLLASLSPACLFLAWTIHQPDGRDLNEYPLFLGLNVAFIAAAGAVALIHQAWNLLRRYSLDLGRSTLALAAWLSLSLFVGGQCAWYLRPFFGVSTIGADAVPIFMGTQPDYRGDTNFYEAVYHVVAPPRR